MLLRAVIVFDTVAVPPTTRMRRVFVTVPLFVILSVRLTFRYRPLSLNGQRTALAVHPRAKHSLALRLRTLCRRALRLGSALHRRLCWQLLGHPGEDVRSHIWCLVRYEGQSIWRAGGRDASEITDSGDWDSRMGRDGRTWAICRCDPLRDIVEGIMLPCVSKAVSQEGSTSTEQHL